MYHPLSVHHINPEPVNPSPVLMPTSDSSDNSDIKGSIDDLIAERQERQRQIQERQAEEEEENEEEENDDEEEEEEEEQNDEEHEEESDRSRSPPRQGRIVRTTQYWVTQFCKLKPPTFRGKLDLAEDWLKRLEKIFKVIECPENRKAEPAIYRLEGDADRWWEVIATTLRDTLSSRDMGEISGEVP
ncbi:hypothetical protein K1719_001261 [Acacia pycnantha]|nr:hypothetical protein K1719_001261 [Acacia pycnantha]